MRREAPPHAHTWEITVAETAPYEVTEDGVVYVGLKLAHPYAKEYAERVQAKDKKEYKVGDTIFVTREWGNAMIDGGYVQIDPTDKEARQAALFLNKRNQPLTSDEVAKQLAGGDADAATPAPTEKPQSAADKSAKSATAN